MLGNATISNVIAVDRGVVPQCIQVLVYIERCGKAVRDINAGRSLY
jgi:hypothetical protein